MKRIVLGLEYAGVFSNDDDVADGILDAGPKVGENVWRLPIPAAYERHIDSPIADVKNTGNGRAGGSITAALFLQRFTNGTPWAHIDIASTAWVSRRSCAFSPEAAVAGSAAHPPHHLAQITAEARVRLDPAQSRLRPRLTVGVIAPPCLEGRRHARRRLRVQRVQPDQPIGHQRIALGPAQLPGQVAPQRANAVLGPAICARHRLVGR